MFLITLYYSFLLHLFILCVGGVCVCIRASHGGSLGVRGRLMRAGSPYCVGTGYQTAHQAWQPTGASHGPSTYFLRQGCSPTLEHANLTSKVWGSSCLCFPDIRAPPPTAVYMDSAAVVLTEPSRQPLTISRSLD